MHANGKHRSDHKKAENILKKAMSDVSEKGKALFEDSMESAKDVLKDKAAQIRKKASELNGKSFSEISDDLADYVREKPIRSLLIAVGFGYILGKIFKKDE